ncbi:hypothetical protein SGFS_034200 [Streptomyces graminofaciens]|jgi:DNA-binding response OmpR family regulator|uniref:OmpR/PhoB-type domain-containing protein n=1 Tax=Streptomyces graminofaciens TaxID=68212 RepID=A0ABN5VFX5_9ACTN|nr:response regulator transcription factor [Streptomyces graminofaciens]BBC32126.1 hypothetical protein SGFS_034200 [Streptomyces graminofaciens]
MGTPPTSVSSSDGTTRVFVAHEKLSRAMLLYRQLRSKGLHVIAPRLGPGVSPLRQIHAYRPDVVLLGVTSPRSPWDAMALARTLRAQPVRPGILFLTGGPCRATDLSLADDYTLDGCSAAELTLRVEVLLTRRSASDPAPPTPRQAPAPGLHVLAASRRVLLHGHEVTLTATEFDILQVLVEHAGQVVPKGEILDRVWHHDFNGESNIVEAYICNLRRKLADSQRTLITTVRGIGYRLAADDQQFSPDAAVLA